MGVNMAVQLMNILVLAAMLIIPFVFVYFLIKSIRKKHEANEQLEIRVAMLEQKVRALELYIEASE